MLIFNGYVSLVSRTSLNRLKALRDQEHGSAGLSLCPLCILQTERKIFISQGRFPIPTQVRLTDLQACQEISCDQGCI